MLRRAHIIGVLLAAVALPALAADFIVNGNVDVGTSGKSGNLNVTGVSNLKGTVNAGVLNATGSLNVTGVSNLTGNVNVGTTSTDTAANLAVNGHILVPQDPAGGTPICNLDHLGEIGTALYQPIGTSETDAMLYFCGVRHSGNGTDAPQRYFLNASMDSKGKIWPSWWPGDVAAAPAAGGRADTDTAALATRVAILEQQVAALKAIACRDHASEAACR